MLLLLLIGSKNVKFCIKKVYFQGTFLYYFIQSKSAGETLRILELRLTKRMVCQKQHAETGFNTSKILILNLRIKNALVYQKSLIIKDWKNCRQDPSQKLTELGKSSQVDEPKVPKHLRALGMIQKQRHYVPHELKPEKAVKVLL